MANHYELTYGKTLPDARGHLDYVLRETLENGIQLWCATSLGSHYWTAIEPGVFLGDNTGFCRGDFSASSPGTVRVGWVFDGDLSLGRDGRIWGKNYGAVQGENAPCQTFTQWREAIDALEPQPRLPVPGQQTIPSMEAA